MRNSISVVIPVFNEEDSIVKECNRIRDALSRAGYQYEIILVDDCSTDKSLNFVRGLSYVKTIHLDQRKGSGNARKIGTLEATGDIVVWTDCDLTYPNHLIPDIVEEMLKKGYDQVIAARKNESGSWICLRVAAKWIIRKMACILTHSEIPDLNSGLRAFRRETCLVYLPLLPEGFSCMATMTLSYICDQKKVGYFPICSSNRFGVSKFHPIRDTYKYFVQTIKVVSHFKHVR